MPFSGSQDYINPVSLLNCRFRKDVEPLTCFFSINGDPLKLDGLSWNIQLKWFKMDDLGISQIFQETSTWLMYTELPQLLVEKQPFVHYLHGETIAFPHLCYSSLPTRVSNESSIRTTNIQKLSTHWHTVGSLSSVVADDDFCHWVFTSKTWLPGPPQRWNFNLWMLFSLKHSWFMFFVATSPVVILFQWIGGKILTGNHGSYQ